MMRSLRSPVLWIVLAVLALAGGLWLVRPRPSPSRRAAIELPARGPMTIVATGDSFVMRQLPRDPRDAGAAAAFEIVRAGSLALTNLEENLLTDATARKARSDPAARWPAGSTLAADELQWVGIDVVSLANNHATDYGLEGLDETVRILRDAGLLPVGSGPDLEQARAPLLVGGGPRKIAVIAAASSSTAESRATAAHGEINGRPGINPLRYVANITADPTTFESLRQALPALQSGPAATDRRPSDRQLSFFGTTVTLGEHTSVTLAVDETDMRGMLDQIRRARTQAEVVIVSVHSHEPTNDSDTPADFLRLFAHAAVDAGATLIVGHGPHRLRGIELYNGGAILYSLGNFIYQAQGMDLRDADVYDAGTDLFNIALGTGGDRRAARRSGFDDPEWWQGVIATTTVDDGHVTQIRLQPIDLGVDAPKDARGTPRTPAPARAAAILDRVSHLSDAYGTHVRVEGGVGVIDLER
jgi:poly-gamma-glutamate capsule biosynthesis protein CapA/YwtB (metallophosphatase superfamily)